MYVLAVSRALGISTGSEEKLSGENDDDEDDDTEQVEAEEEQSEPEQPQKQRSAKNSASKSKASDDHNEVCEVCEKGGDLLCCDTCTLVFHLECIRPKLSAVPKGRWSCPHCIVDVSIGIYMSAYEGDQNKI